jgi:hypothetical protein
LKKDGRVLLRAAEGEAGQVTRLEVHPQADRNSVL